VHKNLLLLPRPIEDPPGAICWTLHAATDFSTAANFIRDAKTHDRSTADYVGLLIGALVSYARPFCEYNATQNPRVSACKHYLLGLATDLGADLQMHATALRARDKLIARSIVKPGRLIDRTPKVNTLRLKTRQLSHQSLTILAARLDLEGLHRVAGCMQLACLFLLADINPAAL
jgi:hypothetical protein